MTTLVFDTLKLARKLEAAGFPAKQAADTAEALAESLGEGSGLATRADIDRLGLRIDALEDRIIVRLIKWLLGVATGATGHHRRGRDHAETDAVLKQLARAATSRL